MPYCAHDTFTDPHDQEQFVWRYVDISKFARLLSTETLHFTRLDRFQDPFEGRSSPNAARRLAAWYERALEEDHIPVRSRQSPDDLREMFLNTASLRASTFASCWHLSTHESAAMWSQYLTHGEGIAIRSTVAKLKRCFEASPETVYIGNVRYIDYEADMFQGLGNVFSYALHKRKSFEHEKELRAVTQWNSRNGSSVPTEGFDIRIAIDTLVDRVFVAPGTSQWFTETVQALVTAFGYRFPVERSTMLDAPAWTV